MFSYCYEFLLSSTILVLVAGKYRQSRLNRRRTLAIDFVIFALADKIAVIQLELQAGLAIWLLIQIASILSEPTPRRVVARKVYISPMLMETRKYNLGVIDRHWR
ncbi:MAG: hypothetical protein CL607_28695 [Anaerolineaceae bacterium]|nr:hypothetical protein [Anaerolineaceae bacterium]